MMKRIRALLTFFFVMICAVAGTRADTIYFENGGSVEGIVRQEAGGEIEIDVGFGTITLSRSQIRHIERSTPEELMVLRDTWINKQVELKGQEEEFLRAREKRLAEYEKWVEDEQARQLRTRGPQEVEVVRDLGSTNILVDVLLNQNVKATLVLDTGASLIVLTKRVGRELGVDVTDSKKDIISLQMAAGRKIEARLVMLKSVQIKEIEVKDVMAAVLLEDTSDIGFKDGLLGMTFLSKFNMKIDLKNMTIVLEKI